MESSMSKDLFFLDETENHGFFNLSYNHSERIKSYTQSHHILVEKISDLPSPAITVPGPVPKLEVEPEPVITTPGPWPLPKLEVEPEPVITTPGPWPLPKLEVEPEPVITTPGPWPLPKLEIEPVPVTTVPGSVAKVEPDVKEPEVCVLPDIIFDVKKPEVCVLPDIIFDVKKPEVCVLPDIIFDDSGMLPVADEFTFTFDDSGMHPTPGEFTFTFDKENLNDIIDFSDNGLDHLLRDFGTQPSNVINNVTNSTGPSALEVFASSAEPGLSIDNVLI
jgi:hypothetical protein